MGFYHFDIHTFTRTRIHEWSKVYGLHERPIILFLLLQYEGCSSNVHDFGRQLCGGKNHLSFLGFAMKKNFKLPVHLSSVVSRPSNPCYQ